jgi:aryl sulfotransferase
LTMAKIIWLASYPKSGNTWMRALLTNYRNNADTPADINELDGGPIASARALFDEWVGVEASTLEDTVIDRLRPAVYRCVAREAGETVYMKVHDAWSLTDRGEPLFPADATAGVVYIIRNPLDLAASWAHHSGSEIADAVESLCDAAGSARRVPRGLDQQLRQRRGSWSEHVRSWTEDSGLEVHVVRYEDLHRDPEEVFAGVLDFCGLAPEAARVSKAVAFSNIDELRRQEATRGFRERSARTPGQFFRRAAVGSWRDELSVEQVGCLTDAHRETMIRWGYLETAAASPETELSR